MLQSDLLIMFLQNPFTNYENNIILYLMSMILDIFSIRMLKVEKVPAYSKKIEL